MSTSENLIIRLLPEIISLQQLLLQQQRHIMDTLANLASFRDSLKHSVASILAKLNELKNLPHGVDPAAVQAVIDDMSPEVQKLVDAVA